MRIKGRTKIPIKEISQNLLIFVLICSPVFIGGIHLTSVFIFSLFSSFSLCLYSIYRFKREKPIYGSSIFFLLLSISFISFFQIIPLPPFFHEIFNPTGHKIYVDSLKLAGVSDHKWHPISLERGRTLIESLKFLGYAIFFITLMNLATKEERSRKFLKIIVYSGVIVVLIGCLHFAFDAKKILWTYESSKDMEKMLFFSTFVNENHLASFLTIPALLSFGFFIERSKRSNFLYLLSFLLCAGGIFLALSRGGISSFILGILICFIWLLYKRMRDKFSKKITKSVLCMGTLFAGAISVFIYLFFLEFTERLPVSSKIFLETKFRVFLKTAELIKDFPFFGTGKGAFSSAFSIYNNIAPNSSFTHVENFILEILSGFGLIIGGGILITSVIIFIQLLRKIKYRALFIVSAGAIISTIAHDLIDFSLEIPAIAFSFTLLLSILKAGEIREIKLHQNGDKILKHNPLFMLIFGILSIILILTGYILSNPTSSLYGIEISEEKLKEISSSEKSQGESLIKEAIKNQPANCETILLSGKIAKVINNNELSKNLIRRSHFLCRGRFNTTLQRIATEYEERDIESLKFLLKEFFKFNEERGKDLWEILLKKARRLKDIYPILKDNDRLVKDFTEYLSNLGDKKFATAFVEKYYDEKKEKTSVELIELLGNLYLQQGENEKAEKLGFYLIGKYPSIASGYKLLGKVYYINKKYFEATHLLKEAIKLEHNNMGKDKIKGELLQSLFLLAENYVNLKNKKMAEDIKEKLLKDFNYEVISGSQKIRFIFLTSAIKELNGNYTSSFLEIQKILKENPMDTRALLKAAELSEKMGDINSAINYYKNLKKINPGLKWIEERIEILKLKKQEILK